MAFQSFQNMKILLLALLCSPAGAFQSVSSPRLQLSLAASNKSPENEAVNDIIFSRRSVLAQSASFGAAAFLSTPVNAEESMFAPKFVQTYEDFTPTSEGWSYKDVKIGSDAGGGDLKDGDRVVFDWSGYTIGYFGRPFEAKG